MDESISRERKNKSMKIRKFDIDDICTGSVILMVGKRKTGKSSLVTDLMANMADKFSYGIAFCPTEDSSRSLQKFMPRTCIFSDYREDKVEALMAMQRRYWARPKGGREVFILMDDVTFDKGIWRSRTMRELAMNGRHRHVTLLICCQFLFDLPPDIRSQIDIVFALRENVHSNKEKLFKNFWGFFDNYGQFSETMDSLTRDYGAIVYDASQSSSTKVEENCFWYKAKVDHDFRVIDDAIWDIDEKVYVDPISDEREAQVQPAVLKLTKDGRVVR